MATLFLPAEWQLTVTADADSTGTLFLLVSGGLKTTVAAVSASTTPTFGPFNSGRFYDLVSDTGLLVDSIARQSVIEGTSSDLTAAELNTLVGLTSNTTELNKLDTTAAGLTAAELSILDGVTSLAGELNILDNAPSNVTIAYATGVGTDNIRVTMTVVDSAAAAITDTFLLDVWISDSANGEVLTSTAATGALTLITGEQREEVTAKKHIRISTDENGVALLDLVDSNTTAGEYFCVKHPTTGASVIGPATASGDYESG